MCAYIISVRSVIFNEEYFPSWSEKTAQFSPKKREERRAQKTNTRCLARRKSGG